MRVANVLGRATLMVADGGIDIEDSSEGRWPSDPLELLGVWDEFRKGASGLSSAAAKPVRVQDLRAPVPNPRQVFAVGMNYVSHAEELDIDKPGPPSIFTKFPSSIGGPSEEVALPAGSIDWEVEVVAVVGRTASKIDKDSGWDFVAGLTIGQDLSEREMQFIPPYPQFSLAKSFPGFGPTGPVLVTPEEFDDRDNLALACEVNGSLMQDGRTKFMIHSVPELVSRLSHVVTLFPGDLIFTGTPDGVGVGRKPPLFLHQGDVVVSRVEGIGEITTRFV